MVETIGEDLTYPFSFRFPLPVLGAMALFFAGCAALLRGRRGDPFFTLMRGALAGGLIFFLLLPHFTVWRLELAMLLAAAVGVALLAERCRPWLQSRLRTADTRFEKAPAAPVAAGE